MKVFLDRTDGGKRLVPLLKQYEKNPDAVVLGLVRGGVVTADAVADGLDLPLGIMSVKKIGAPFQPELAMGAVCADGTVFLNQSLLDRLSISPSQLQGEIAKKKAEALVKEKTFQKYCPQIDLEGRIVILVDDGLATGASMHASVLSAKERGANKVVVAIPVAAADSYNEICLVADEVVAVATPYDFMAVGEFYRNFAQVEDEEAIECLKKAQKRS